ncbi:MAG: glycoside hydrolase family 127 protein [Bacteroidales bacterium]|nr:glycoside hydrolase family 127 protein [Bacteroidales bacterium]
MKAKIFISLLISAAAFSVSAQHSDIKEVPFTKVKFSDKFWAERIETNRTVSIPSAFKECEKNGRFDNFAVAAGIIKKEHQGDFSFDDTDPYKVIEGASYSLAVHYDKKLDHYLDSVINLIAKAQEADGYLTTCVTNKCTRLSGWWGTKRWEKINSHELYNSGHLIESAVAHYQATGKKNFLNVAIKNADLICKVFGAEEGKIHRPSGHPIVEMALCKLYKVTGKKEYLNMSKYFVEETGRCTDGHHPSEYSQDHKPILQQDEIVGHAVRAGYLYSGVADVAALTGDENYFNALCRIWDNMASKKLFITGGIGSRPQGEGFGPNYELNNHTAYCETCASIANVYWNYRMFLATGDAKYVDVYERALYNGVMSGVSLSGDKFFYDNPLESGGEHERAPWFGCACCPGNVTRFVASISNYVYATRNSDIFVNLYAESDAEITAGKNIVKLSQKTQMPWQGGVEITVEPKKQSEFTMLLRLPSWANDKPVATDLYRFVDKAGNYTLKVNGKDYNAKLQNGYLEIKKTWKKGDKISLDFPMEIRRIKANDNAEDDRGKVALQRGPIVYCLEGVDNENSVFDKSIPQNEKLSFNYEPQLLSGVVTLSGKALQTLQDGNVKTVNFKAIPYSTWNNRGNSEMEVWIAESPAYTRIKPSETIASKATSITLQAPIQKDAPESAAVEGWAFGVNDQWEPLRSSYTAKPYFYWWLKFGSKETLAYKFEEETLVSNVQLYWLEFEHYDGSFKVPESWKLFYKDGDVFKEVEYLSPCTVEKDCYNSVNFKPVKTTALKIEVQLQKGFSGGVLEWKVN